MSYETKNIRNVCLLGHGGSGKTTLAESMLYMTGAIDRQGKTADGNTVCDYDPEEIKRQITISTSIAPVNFGGCKINVLDCPGFFDFAGDVMCALQRRRGRHNLLHCERRHRRPAPSAAGNTTKTPTCPACFTSPRRMKITAILPPSSPPCRKSTAAPSAP